MATTFVRASKNSNCVGRADYITNPDRQETLIGYFSNVDNQYWEKLQFESTDIATRELIIAIPNEFATDTQKANEFAKGFVQEFHTKNGCDFVVGIHSNKNNLHMHLMYNERQVINLNNEPVLETKVIRARYKVDGKYTSKKEYLKAKEQGKETEYQEKKEIVSIKDGTKRFTDKDVKFKSKEWLEQTKLDYTNYMNKQIGKEQEWTTKPKEYHKAQKHIGKGKGTERIVKYNNEVKEYNKVIDKVVQDVKERTGTIPKDLKNNPFKYIREYKNKIISMIREHRYFNKYNSNAKFRTNVILTKLDNLHNTTNYLGIMQLENRYKEYGQDLKQLITDKKNEINPKIKNDIQERINLIQAERETIKTVLGNNVEYQTNLAEYQKEINSISKTKQTFKNECLKNLRTSKGNGNKEVIRDINKQTNINYKEKLSRQPKELQDFLNKGGKTNYIKQAQDKENRIEKATIQVETKDMSFNATKTPILEQNNNPNTKTPTTQETLKTDKGNSKVTQETQGNEKLSFMEKLYKAQGLTMPKKDPVKTDSPVIATKTPELERNDKLNTKTPTTQETINNDKGNMLTNHRNGLANDTVQIKEPIKTDKLDMLQEQRLKESIKNDSPVIATKTPILEQNNNTNTKTPTTQETINNDKGNMLTNHRNGLANDTVQTKDTVSPERINEPKGFKSLLGNAQARANEHNSKLTKNPNNKSHSHER